jgi:hypothetical protein
MPQSMVCRDLRYYVSPGQLLQLYEWLTDNKLAFWLSHRHDNGFDRASFVSGKTTLIHKVLFPLWVQWRDDLARFNELCDQWEAEHSMW